MRSRSKLMRVSQEFARELEEYRKAVGMTYPKITRRLVPVIQNIRYKQIKKEKKRRINKMENMLNECLKI